MQQELTTTNEKNSAILHDADALRELVTGNEAKTKKLEWELSDITLTKDREINNLIKEKNDLKTMKQTLLDGKSPKSFFSKYNLHIIKFSYCLFRLKSIFSFISTLSKKFIFENYFLYVYIVDLHILKIFLFCYFFLFF